MAELRKVNNQTVFIEGDAHTYCLGTAFLVANNAKNTVEFRLAGRFEDRDIKNFDDLQEKYGTNTPTEYCDYLTNNDFFFRVGGGGGVTPVVSLQDAYDNGNLIANVVGSPFDVSGEEETIISNLIGDIFTSFRVSSIRSSLELININDGSGAGITARENGASLGVSNGVGDLGLSARRNPAGVYSFFVIDTIRERGIGAIADYSANYEDLDYAQKVYVDRTARQVGDVKTQYANVDALGWVLLDGRATNTLTATQQANATALGFGANIPNLTSAISGANLFVFLDV